MNSASGWNLQEFESYKWVKSTGMWNLQVCKTRAQRIVGENWFLWHSGWKELVTVKKERVKKVGWKKVGEKKWVELVSENAWVKIGGWNQTGEFEWVFFFRYACQSKWWVKISRRKLVVDVCTFLWWWFVCRLIFVVPKRWKLISGMKGNQGENYV